MESVTVN